MKTVFIFKTTNNNFYIYFLNKQILTHSNKKLNTLIENYLDNKIILDKFESSHEVINDHNFDILKLLQLNEYLNDIDIKNIFKGKITNHHLIKLLSNTKQITFEVTEKCNFNCTYCGYGEFYEDYGKRDRKTLNVNNAVQLLDYLAGYWNSENNNSHNHPIFLSFYGGEPLLEINIIKEIVAHTKQMSLKHNYFVFNMTTNGVYIKKHIDFLVDNNVKLLISLDGNQANNKYRKYTNGKDVFKDVVYNINYVKKHYPEYFEKNINFNAVLHNLNSVESIKRFIQKKFSKFPRIAELSTSGIKENKKKEFWNTYKNFNSSIHKSEDYKMLEDELFLDTPIGNLITTFFNRNLYFNKQSYNELFIERTQRTVMPTGTCLPMSKKIFVTSTGNILPCERINHKYSLGNIDNGNVNFDLKGIENSYNKYYVKLLKLCSKCYNIFDCVQCMFYLNLEDDVIKCNGFTSYKSYNDKLRYIVEYLEENPEKSDWIQKEYEYSF